MFINRNNYLIGEIPELSPISPDYKQYWKEEKFKCDNGAWSGGNWIPGSLHFFINHWTIEIKKNQFDKNPTKGRPFFRDIDLDIHIAYNEARGFSRFSEQTIEEVAGIRPRDIMLKSYDRDMGIPLYENPAKNMILVANRGCGKSFNMSGIIAHDFLFTQVTNQKNEIVVGASETVFSGDLLSKVKLGLDEMKGGIMVGDVYYPPPFSKKYRGSWDSGKFIEARYDVFKGRNRITKGDRNKIHHRCFRNKPTAANGTRPRVLVFEEAGLFMNLMQSWNAAIETVRYGLTQFGSMIAIGTGGDMKVGSVDVSRMFYQPDIYNCVSFEDTWEYKGNIGLFIPAMRGLNEFKDEEGCSKETEAYDQIMTYREKMVNDGADRITIENEIMYRPVKPSEAFLISGGNIFPKSQLQDHLSSIENNSFLLNAGQVGRLGYDEGGKLKWNMDKGLHAIINFPVKNGENVEGAITIWEHPYRDFHTGLVPNFIYIAGTDPLDHDSAEFSTSLFSTIIYKRFFKLDEIFDLPVAEYTGRPDMIEDAYEQTRMMLLYYNAVNLYENNIKGFYAHMKKMHAEHMLADTPGIIKDVIENSKVNRVKGLHMTEQLKDYGERLANTWLRTEYAPGKLNLTKINSIGLLKELIAFNRSTNVDRVMAFFMVMILNEELHNVVVKNNKNEAKINDFFPNFTKNMRRKPNLMGV